MKVPFRAPSVVKGTFMAFRRGTPLVVDGRTLSVTALTVRADRIVAIDVLMDPARLKPF